MGIDKSQQAISNTSPRQTPAIKVLMTKPSGVDFIWNNRSLITQSLAVLIAGRVILDHTL